MALETIFNDASSLMTVVSLVTFLGIIGWTFSAKRSVDFADAASLPFADDHADDFAPGMQNTEKHHG
jgi:cytochrome c oxidase cbb3-type subunit 4